MFGKNTLILGALGAIYAMLEPGERQRLGAAAGRYLPALGGGAFALVHRLPKEAMDVLETTVMPVVRGRLASLGLPAEIMAFNLPHVPVARLSALPDMAALRALARPAQPLVTRLTMAHVLRRSTDEDAGWRLALDVVGEGDFAEARGELARRLRLNKPQPMVCPLVFSQTPISPAVRAELLALAAEIDGRIGGGIPAELADLSVVALGPLGNVVREHYRLSLADGRVWNVTSGQVVAGPGVA